MKQAESVPSLAWAALSRSALDRAEAQLIDKTEGVRDEVGVLALHFGYANRFFPGTSVQQTRLRYALFVPWQLIALMRKPGVEGGQADGALQEAEKALALRLPDVDGAGTIGRHTARRGKHVSIPPSQSYWTALSAWGVLNSSPGGSSPSRSDVYAGWRRWFEARPPTSTITDDENRRLDQPPRLFHKDLPDPPPPVFSGSGELEFRLEPNEAKFLRDRLLDVRREHDLKPSYLATLVKSERVPTARQKLWSKPLRSLADDADRRAILRARDAASLSAVARACYLAAVEKLKDERDRRSSSTRHRDYLAEVVANHGRRALRLKLEEVSLDGVHLGGLQPVLGVVQRWLRTGDLNPGDQALRAVLAEWERRRKGRRAKLTLNTYGREARAAWDGKKAGRAGPIEYRWGLVRQFLADLQGRG